MLEGRTPRIGRLPDGLVSTFPFSQNQIAAVALLLFFVAWSFIQAETSAGRALHFDILEAYAWGKEFQFGYDKHGPFWAWIAGLWFLVFPETNTSFVALEAVNTTLGLFGAWMLIGLFTKGWERHAATLLLLATPFYTFDAYKFNANIIFISLWPWTLYVFVKSLDLMSKRNAFLFGILAAACILSKYYAMLLLATCALSLAVHPNGRRYLFSSLPWVAAATFLVVLSPHIYWLLTAHASTVTYAVGRTGKGWLFTAEHIGHFVSALLLFHAAVILILYFVSLRTAKTGLAAHDGALPRARMRFLAVLAFAPPLLTVLAALVFQLKIDFIMAVGAFPLMPLFLMQLIRPLDNRLCFKAASAVAVAVTVISLLGSPLASALSFRNDNPSVAFPYRELAANATELWHSETHAPLKIIGGDAKVANGISFYSADHPSSFVDLEYGRALWITPQKLKQGGLLIACVHDDAPCLSKAADFKWGTCKQASLKIGHDLEGRPIPEVTIDLFIVPPLE